MNNEPVRKTNMPRWLWEARLDDYTHDAKIKRIVEQYIEDLKFHRETDGKGLMLVGPPGTGKTLLAGVVLREAHEANYRCGFFLTANYLKLLRDMMALEQLGAAGDPVAQEKWHAKNDLHDKIRSRYDFIVLDDVGKEHATRSAWAEDELDLLLRHRYNRGLPTIITSNQRVSEWGFRYSDSMESFLAEAFVPVVAIGDDYRFQRS